MNQNRFILSFFLFLFLFSGQLSAQSAIFNNTNTGATGTIQTWIVPPCVTSITIEAWGAQGGSSDAGPGGLGAKMAGDFVVTPGQVLKILVGQMGTQCGSEGGGGGGTFVTDISDNPLIIAGGGGGSATVLGTGGDTSACGLPGNGGAAFSQGGCSGNGGGSVGDPSSGGGLLTDGGNSGNYPCSSVNGGGKAFINGGNGGTGTCTFCDSTANGGFGGGGGTTGSMGTGIGGGGGGGYSGGGGGSNGGHTGGGGGGSYNSGSNQSNASAVNTGHGMVQISWNYVLFNYTGSTQTFTVPPFVTSITVETWGGGGGGYSGGGGGGGGGGYGKEVLAVTPGNIYNLVVGQGGIHNVGDNDSCRAGSGGASDFGLGLVIATGGEGGRKSDSNPCSAPGIAAGGSSTATVNVNGGDGTSAPASQCCPGTGGNGAGPGGGAGGAPGMPGLFPGGGAGGGSNNILAQDGADGLIKVSWSYDTIALTGDTVICYGENVTLTASGGITYLWSTGATDSTITEHPLTTSTYTLIATNSVGCTDTLTIQVTVNNTPIANFSQNNVCLGTSVDFTNLSSVSLPDTISSYQWDFGDSSPNNIQQQPSHNFMSSGTFNTTLIVTTPAGCADTITYPVAVYDLPVAGFTAINSCLNDSTHFSNTTVNPVMGSIASLIWDFGDGSLLNSTSLNPAHLYSFAGNYTVTQIVNSSYGCADTSVNTVSIFSNPVANFEFSEVCLNQATGFNDLSSGTITSWSWDFGDSTPIDTTQNTNYIYPNAGTYQASLSVVTNNGCTDTITQNVVIHPLPDAQFSVANSCEGAFVQLNSQSTIANPDVIQSWSWDFGDGSTVNNQNTSHLYSINGSYTVQLVTVSGFGCIDSVSRVITLNPKPSANFTTIDTMGCASLCAQFLSVVTNGTMQWNFGDGSALSNLQNPSHCYDNATVTPIVYSVVLTVTSDSGCTNTITKNNYITVNPKPVASCMATAYTILKGNSTQLDVSGVGSYQWAPVTTLSCDTCQSPIATPVETTTYCVVETVNACSDTACLTITVEMPCPGDYTVPNAFSPNNDGHNDLLCLQGWSGCINEFAFLIYDRWGEKVFESTDPSFCWDGNYSLSALGSDKPMNSAVFVYYIKAVDLNGVQINKKGNISLLR